MADKKKKTTWIFDIDTEKFKKKAKEARKKINEIGDPKNLQGLTQGLVQVTAGSVAFIAIAKTLSKTLDIAFRADRLKEINAQFDELTNKTGIAGAELKAQLATAADGLINTNDLLDITNKAMISIGKTAGESMPQLVTLANQISATMGGELVDNLNAMTVAIQTGSTDTFKNMGILLDANKIQREYAKSIGVTVDVLDEQGKQQALLNAVLKSGADKFKNVDTSISKNVDTWTQLKIAVTEFGDTFALVFEKIVGPTLQTYLKSLQGWVGYFKKEFLGAFGEGVEAQQAKIRGLRNNIHELNEDLATAIQRMDIQGAGSLQRNQEKINKIKEEIKLNQDLISQIKDKVAAETKPAEGEAEDGTGGPIGVDLDKQKTRQAQFEQEILAIKQARVAKEISLNAEVEQADVLHNEQRALILEDFNSKLDQLRARREEGLLLEGEYNQLEVELYSQRTNALIEQENSLADVRGQALDNYLEQSESTAEGFQRAFEVAGKKAAADMKDFGKQGSFAVSAFSNNATSALLALGEGTKSAGEAMKGFMLGALADIAESHGKLYLLQAFTNPALAAAGAGLIVLAGFLRGQAGGGGGSSSGGGAPPAVGGGFDAEEPEIKPITEETEKKKLEINFHGDFLETAETQQRFVDVIREASDVQEFNINKIE